jgi:hypothetical protein
MPMRMPSGETAEAEAEQRGWGGRDKTIMLAMMMMMVMGVWSGVRERGVGWAGQVDETMQFWRMRVCVRVRVRID